MCELIFFPPPVAVSLPRLLLDDDESFILDYLALSHKQQTPTSGTKRSRPSTPASASASVSATKKTKARKTNAGDSDEDEDEHEHENDDEALTPVAKRVKTLVSSNKKKNKEVEEVKPEPVVSDDDDGFLV